MPDRRFFSPSFRSSVDELTRKSGVVVAGVCLAVVARYAVVTGLVWYAGETSTDLGRAPTVVRRLVIAAVVATALLSYSS